VAEYDIAQQMNSPEQVRDLPFVMIAAVDLLNGSGCCKPL